MALKIDNAKRIANRLRVAEEARRVRDSGRAVLAKDIAESLSLDAVTVGKHLRALGWSSHGKMGWSEAKAGEWSALDAATGAWCLPSATADGAMAEAEQPTRVGRCEWFWPTVDADLAIDDMECQADEFVEDGADLWLGGSVTKEDVGDLQRRLQEAVDEWMRDNGLQPLLYRVVEGEPC